MNQFARTSRTAYQQPISSNLLERYVYSEAELIQAISDAVADNRKSFAPRKIVIAGSMQLSQTIILPADCPGLTIEAVSYAILYASTPIDAVFSMRGEQQQINNVYARVDTGSANTIGTLVTSDAGTPTACTIDHCRTFGVDNLLTVDASVSFEFGRIAACQHLPTTDGYYISGPVLSSVIESNIFDGAGQINIGAAGGKNVISGNISTGGSINTTASIGQNSISGNVWWTVDRKDTDAVAGNT